MSAIQWEFCGKITAKAEKNRESREEEKKSCAIIMKTRKTDYHVHDEGCTPFLHMTAIQTDWELYYI